MFFSIYASHARNYKIYIAIKNNNTIFFRALLSKLLPYWFYRDSEIRLGRHEIIYKLCRLGV